MADETPSPEPAESTQATPSPDDSLNSIANEFPVEEQAKQFTAQPQVQQSQFQAQPQISDFAPDPVTNPEGYKAFMRASFESQQQVQSALREMTSRFNQFEQTIQEQKVNAEVDAAVQTVNSKLKVDPMLTEALLNVEYKQNPSFKRIWDNRQKNPEAFKKGLEVLANKLYQKVQVRQDPQLAENVRAAQTSQRAMSTTKNAQQEEVPKDPREFDRWWAAQVRGHQ